MTIDEAIAWARAEQKARYAAEDKLVTAHSELAYLEQDAENVIKAWDYRESSFLSIGNAIERLRKRLNK